MIESFLVVLGTRHGMMAILAICVMLIAFGLERRNRNKDSAFAFDDLLLGEDGKASKSAAVMFGAFALTSWVIAYLTITDRLTEGYFAAYIGCWVVPTVATIIKGKQPDVTVRTETASITETSVGK